MLNEVRIRREIREDFSIARVVAMVAAQNSKQRRYNPEKYMFKHNRDHMREMSEEGERCAIDPAKGMTGEQVMRAFRSMGVPIIDQRGKKS